MYAHITSRVPPIYIHTSDRRGSGTHQTNHYCSLPQASRTISSRVNRKPEWKLHYRKIQNKHPKCEPGKGCLYYDIQYEVVVTQYATTPFCSAPHNHTTRRYLDTGIQANIRV